MKRFTETTKWRDPWFRKLTPQAKLLWFYITDNCDSTGLIDLDLEAATFDTGAKLNEKHVGELESRLQRINGGGKFFVGKFIPFQYGILSDACPAHKPILRLVRERSLSQSEIGYQYPNARVLVGYQYPTGKEEDKKGKEEGIVKGSEVAPIPEGFSDAFGDVWLSWLKHRQEIKKPLTPTSVAEQLKQLTEWGEPRSTAAITHTIRKGWQGLVEPDPKRDSVPAPKSKDWMHPDNARMV